MKHLKTLLCLALALCLLMSFTACSKKPAVVGNWTTTLELANQMKEEIQGSDADGFLKDFELDSFALLLNAEFKEDGTYTISVDRESGETAIQNLKDALKQPLRSYYESLGWDVDSMGMDLDSVVDNIFTENNADDLYDDLEISGTYRLDGDKLYLSESADEAPDEESYAVVEIQDDTFSITELSGDDEQNENLNKNLPLVFTRSN